MAHGDVYKQAERCVSIELIERYFSAKGAKYDKTRNEYYTLSPIRPDDNVKSGTFSINTSTGLWNDMAANESGNLIQLVARVHGISKFEAAKKIIEDSGGVVEKKMSEPTKQKKPKAIIPIPETAKNEINELVQSKYYRDKYGKAVAIYPYKDIDDNFTMVTCRFDGEDGKNILPFYYTEKGWKNAKPEIKRIPLYHENQLTENEKCVLVVEGEKCANIQVEGMIVVSWLGGVGQVGKADFSVLENRKVTIWPDCDEAGTKAAYKIKEVLPKAEILKIEGKPKGWDIADAKIEAIDIAEFIKKCPRLVDCEAPVNPYDAFHQIRRELYGDDNLEQIDGVFYVYDEKRHFWQERLKINIESDIQKWIELHHIEYLLETDKQIHTFIQNTAMFLSRWSRKFYNTNPFKESVLQPFIHVKNGAIEITDEGFKFHDREEKGEQFFRDLHPLHCLDFDFDMKYYESKDLQTCAPAFYHYIKSLIPDRVENYDAELELTTEFFSQVIAYTINPIKKKPRFFALYGGQNTGKSFFVEVLETIIGQEFFVVRKIKDMENRFAAADLWGSKVFVDDDVKANVTLPDDFIKNYTGQKSITIEKKNRDAIKGVRISVAMFFISNHSFAVSGGTEGIERRLIYIPYRKKIKNPDVYLKDKITGKCKKGKESGKFDGTKFDERPAILGMALRGLELLVGNNHDFTMPEWIRREREQWLISSNTITQFLHEEIYCGDITRFTPKMIYDKYREWCTEEERRSYGRNSFYDKLKLEDRIEFRHNSYGDEFIIQTDEVIEKNEQEDIPF